MKKITFAFIAIALVGVLSAFTTSFKTNADVTMRAIQKIGTKYYVFDGSANAGFQAVDASQSHTCVTETNKVCTLTADPVDVLQDATGYYFLEADISSPDLNKKWQ